MEIHPKIKLAGLWTTLMFLYIYADYFNMMTPHTIQDMIDLKTPLGPTTPGMLIGFSILLIIPALLISASLLLPYKLNRWLNMVFAIIYGVISILIILSDFGYAWMAFFVLYQVVELGVFGMIIRVAWKWQKDV